MGQVLTVQPFGNVVDMVKLNGSILRQAFEHSVAKYDPRDRPGAFFQMSGDVNSFYYAPRSGGVMVPCPSFRPTFCPSALKTSIPYNM